MSDMSTAQEPLGIAALLTNSFSLLLSRFFLFVGIAFLPVAVMSFLPLFLGIGMFTGAGADPFAAFSFSIIVFTILSIVVSTLVSAIIILAAYDAKLGNEVRVGTYVSRSLAAIVPIVILGIVYTIAVMLGAILLIIPGLYLAARLFAFTPAILIEGAGFSGLSRSSELTEGYRWPIVGLLVVLIALALGLGYLQELLFSFSVTTTGLYAAVGVQTVVTTITTAASGVLSALVYARLRAIKEGVGMDDLAKVFA